MSNRSGYDCPNRKLSTGRYNATLSRKSGTHSAQGHRGVSLALRFDDVLHCLSSRGILDDIMHQSLFIAWGGGGGGFKTAACVGEFWPSLDRNFSGFGCTLEAKTTVSDPT